MPLIQKIPRRLQELLGPDGTDEYVDFLNVALDAQKSDVVQLVSDRFERIVSEEVGKVRMEVASLRVELKGDLAGLDSKVANIRAELKSDMAAQTKWIVVTFLGVAAFISVVLPFMWKLADTVVR